MISDSIRKWNPWWAEGRVPKELLGTVREKLEEIKDFINIRNARDVIGVRRCGKSFLLHQLVQHFISSGVNPKNIILVNFDDNEIYNAGFDKILTECRKINPEVSHIFLDEVQEKRGWERWVRTLYDTREFKEIFISGSSSSVLKSEISRVLTGRHSTFVLYPFSFGEYLRSHGWDNFEFDYLAKKKGKLTHFLEKYINEGGFPEILGKSKFESNKYLNDLFDDILARDIAARHNADYDIAKRIAYYIASHSSKIMSHRSISRACSVSTDTVSKYVPLLNECFLIQPLKKFSPKLKEQMREINKYYTIDTGLANSVGYRFRDEFSRLMENSVFMELKRRYGEDKKISIFYWQDSSQKEVDFVVIEGTKTKHLIQVCYDTDSSEKTEKRELSGLFSAMEYFRTDDGMIITWDREEAKEKNGKTVNYVPLWKWLLEKPAS